MAITTPDRSAALFLSILPTADTILAQQASLSNNLLIAGVRMLQKSRPEEAVPFFKKALAMDSSSIDAYNYLGNTYLKLNKNDDAIATFKKLVAMKPFDKDSAVTLGNAYAQAKKYADAETSYKKAVSLAPNDNLAHYSLGQTYLLQNKLKEAETEFQKVTRISPRDANGYYALGATYNKMGKYDTAISNLKQAVNLKHGDFALAETELGYAYAGKGDDYLLQKQITKVGTLDTAAAQLLKASTIKTKILNVDYGPNNPFYSQFGAYTPLSMLSMLDPAKTLESPNATKDFTMIFQFNGDMDSTSVKNITNWKISKAAGGKAGYYNHGYTLNPQTQADLPLMKSVSYDSTKQQATITFSLKQNATANAVIDPSHLVFKFSGVDVRGKAMDTNGDEFDGFGQVF
ncbi:MAG: tetratricopeptide repeat protein [Desulfuromonadales bacterium]